MHRTLLSDTHALSMQYILKMQKRLLFIFIRRCLCRFMLHEDNHYENVFQEVLCLGTNLWQDFLHVFVAFLFIHVSYSELKCYVKLLIKVPLLLISF